MTFEKVKLKVERLPEFKGDLPKYETSGASGLDIRACLREPLNVQPLQRVLIPTGIRMEIPEGFEIQVRPRSGLAVKEGLTIINAPGTIDSDYRGELKIALINLGAKSVTIHDQDRIAQLVLCPVFHVDWQPVEKVENSPRGAGGFGSTGKK